MPFNWPHIRANMRTARAGYYPPTSERQYFQDKVNPPTTTDLECGGFRQGDSMATTVVTPAPVTPVPSKSQELLGLFVTLGLTAASIFIKNPATQQHAANIINVMGPFVAQLEGLL
jgi:hypothetical protein